MHSNSMVKRQIATNRRSEPTRQARRGSMKIMSSKIDDVNNDDNRLLQDPLLPPTEVLPVSIDADLENGNNECNGNDDNGNNLIIDESGWDHGVVQTDSLCRDRFWAFLFLTQFFVVFVVSMMGIRNMIIQGSKWIPPTNSTNDDDDHDINWHVLWFSISILGSSIAITSILVNLLLGALSSMLIQISLVTAPILSFIAFVFCLLNMYFVMAVTNLIMLMFGVCCAYHCWHKVPLATANINLALRGIQDNHGLWILAYGFTMKSYAWIFLWCCAVTEIVVFSSPWVYECSSISNGGGDGTDDNTNNDETECHLSTRGKFIAVGMLLNFFWTMLVVKNIFHTTITGTIGTWWFDPDEATSESARSANRRSSRGFRCSCSCGCSSAIYNSLYRSSIYSFGSICLGSLLVGTLQVLRFLLRCGRKHQNDQRRLGQQRNIEATDLLFCLVQYLVELLERLMEYINAWAYVYVGLYGYDYWTAGKAVSDLFKARGWTVIINDHLIGRSLSMMSMLIGLITGLVGVLLGSMFFKNGPLLDASVLPYFSFFVGYMLGVASCGILFGVITSAVNTIVVCFAESPSSLRNNHGPELFDDLIDSWRKAYPEECGF